MKHLTTLLVLIISLCACTQTPTEETFVNPLFYEKIRRSRPYKDYIKITPTSLSQKCYDGLTGSSWQTNYTCEMLANTDDIVILKCNKTLTPNNISEEEKKLFVFNVSQTELDIDIVTEMTVRVQEIDLSPYLNFRSDFPHYIIMTPEAEKNYSGQ
jgi:uncharacterized lipoprotein YehR (DUF1307 family)